MKQSEFFGKPALTPKTPEQRRKELIERIHKKRRGGEPLSETERVFYLTQMREDREDRPY